MRLTLAVIMPKYDVLMPLSDIAAGSFKLAAALRVRTEMSRRAASPARTPKQIGFLLLPGFPLMSYASAVEPLRAANQLSGKVLYTWRHISIDGAPVRASAGVGIIADFRVGSPAAWDAVFICAGGNPAKFRHRGTMQWLRDLARTGVAIAGMSGGSYILARAGVLGGYRCTIHWDHIAAFVEDFPDLDVRRTLYEIDRDRVTCAGGTSSLDMMLELIAMEHGRELSASISEWYLRTQPRAGSGPQRMALRDRHGVSSERLIRALSLMEDNIEEPLSLAQLAQGAGITPRHLERLFAQSLSSSPMSTYLRLRLERAQELLRQTSLPVLEVAMAAGFVSVSHFSRVYAQRFGRPPRDERSSIQSP